MTELANGLAERLAAVRVERAALAAEMAAQEARARQLGDEEGHIVALLEHLQGAAVRANGVVPSTTTAAEAVADTGTVRPWKETAVRVLADRGGPLHYRDLHEELRRLGVTFGGQNPAASFLAVLTRDGDFVRVGRGQYWLRSMAPADAAPAKAAPRRRRAKVRRVAARTSTR